MPNQRPLRLHVCTPTPDQLPAFKALRRWLTQAGHVIPCAITAPQQDKLRAAAECDVCLLLLGPTFGRCAPLSSFSDAELEASAATDVHPGKLLVFAQDSIVQPTSPEQAEFIERQRHFVGGVFSGMFQTPNELIGQVREALAAWRPPQPQAPPQPLAVRPEAIMISSVTALTAAREVVRGVLDEHQTPAIDFLHAPGEAATPIDRVMSWAHECRALFVILGSDYGYISPVDGLGITELEFTTAFRAGRPIFAFLDATAQALLETTEEQLRQERRGGSNGVDEDQWQFVQRAHMLLPAAQVFRFRSAAELRGHVLEALAQLARGMSPRPTVSVPLATQRRWYRRQLRRWLGVLPHLTQPRGMPLEAVYVSLQTLVQAQLQREEQKEKQNDQQRSTAEDAQTQTKPEQVFAREGAQVAEAKDKPRRDEQPTPTTPIEVDEALKRYPRFVLRGNPGAGKSVALRWYAINAPDTITPVFIRLAAYARTRQQKQTQGEPYPLLAAISGEEARLALSGDADTSQWRDALQAGQGLVLLDAFDEVPASQQAEVAGEIQALAEQLRPETRVVVTARIAGFSTQLGPQFTVTEVQALRPAQQRQLVEQWLRAAHRDTAEEQEIALSRADQLMTFLGVEKRLAEWAETPLLLTFLAALVDAPGGVAQHLPTTKAVIYRRVLRLLLGRWRTLNLRRAGDYLWPKEQLLLALARMGILEGHGEVITPGELAEAWDRVIAGMPASDRARAPAAGELQEMLSAQDGVLIRLGDGQYSFLHPTFQEYLAAALLATSGSAEYRPLLARRRLSSRWEEVSQLLVSELDRLGATGAADGVIRDLVKWDNKKVGLLGGRDPLRLSLARAARCQSVRDPSLASTRSRALLLKRWQRIDRETYRQRNAIEEYLFARGRDVFMTLGGTSLRIPNLQRRLHAQQHEKRKAAAVELGQLGPVAATPVVIAELVRALADQADDVQRAAAQALGQFGPLAATPPVIAALSRTLQYGHVYVRSAAAQALGQLGPAAATPEVVAALVRGQWNSFVREQAAAALRQLGQLEPDTAIAPVVEPLAHAHGDRDAEVAMGAAVVLRELGPTAAVLEALSHALADEDANVRRSAAQELGHLGPTAATPATVVALVYALESPDVDSRSAAARALGQLGPTAATPAMLAALVRALGDEDANVRSAAAGALGELGPAAASPDVVEALLRALDDESEHGYVLRSSAADALGQLGSAAAVPPVVEALVRVLSDDSDDYFRASVRESAAKVLAQLGTAAATPAALDALADALPSKAAAEALGQFGPLAATPPVLNALVSALEGRDSYFKSHEYVARALGQMGPAAATPAVVKALLLALGDQQWFDWNAAAEALRQLGPAVITPAMVDYLVAALGDLDDDEKRFAAARALGRLGPVASIPVVVEALVRALEDRQWSDRQGVIEALEQLGPVATTATVFEALTRTLNDYDSAVRKAAGEALWQLGSNIVSPALAEVLVRSLSMGHPHYPPKAAKALMQRGPDAVPSVMIEALGQALRDRDRFVRESAATVLKELGPAAVVLEAFTRVLEDEDEQVRWEAAMALGELGPEAATPAVLDALVRAMRDPEWAVRSSTAEALGRLGPAAATPAALDALVHAMKDEDDHVRGDATEALGNLGSAAATPAVVEALRRALEVENDLGERHRAEIARQEASGQWSSESKIYVNNYAAKALGELGPAAATPLVLDALVRAVGDPAWGARRDAVEALGRQGSAAAIPAVLKALRLALRDASHYGASIRGEAVTALGRLGPTAAPVVVEALRQALADKDWNAAEHAASTLGQLGPAAATPAVVEALTRALETPSWGAFDAAAVAVGHLGPAAATISVVEALADKIGDPQVFSTAKEYATAALERLGSQAYRRLLEGFHRFDKGKREACASVLTTVIPTIEDASSDEPAVAHRGSN